MQPWREEVAIILFRQPPPSPCRWRQGTRAKVRVSHLPVEERQGTRGEGEELPSPRRGAAGHEGEGEGRRAHFVAPTLTPASPYSIHQDTGQGKGQKDYRYPLIQCKIAGTSTCSGNVVSTVSRGPLSGNGSIAPRVRTSSRSAGEQSSQ